MKDAGTFGSLRGQLPGFFSPDSDTRKSVYQTGLIVADTNVLLDLYRFRSEARQDLVEALRKCGDRLFVPHRVAEEFLGTRTSVIRSRATDLKSLYNGFDRVRDEVQKVLRDAQEVAALPSDAVERIGTSVADVLREAKQDLRELLDEKNAVAPGRPDSHDKVLEVVEELLDGKVGPPLSRAESTDACNAARERFALKIPPGFADSEKEFHLAVGDYIVWRQVVNESARRKAPVLLITGDLKQDWVRRDGTGKPVGPHPALVSELQEVCDQSLIWADATTFLEEASAFLSVDVSERTLDESRFALRYGEREVTQEYSATFRRWTRNAMILLRRREDLEAELLRLDEQEADCESPSQRLELDRRRDRIKDELRAVREATRDFQHRVSGRLDDGDDLTIFGETSHG